jgi:hypothetical protein
MNSRIFIKMWTIISLISAAIINQNNSQFEVVSQVIHDIIIHLTTKRNLTVDILLLGEDLSEIFHDIISKNKDDYLYRTFALNFINFTRESREVPYNLTDVAILLCDNFDHRELFFNFIEELYNSLRKDYKLFFTYMTNEIEENIIRDAKRNIFCKEMFNSEYFEYFIYESRNKNFKLSTFEVFTEESCVQPLWTELNEFEVDNMKWKHELNIEKKFKNFHKCPLILSNVNKPNLNLVHGVVRAIAQMHNASIEFCDEPKSYNVFLRVIEEEMEEKILHLKDFRFQPNGNHLNLFDLRISKIYDFEEVVIIITPNELYTSYEKMLLPFDNDTWVYLLITFCGAFMMIFCLKFLPTYVKEFFYGKNVQYPAFNVVGTFFGIGQLRLPTQNFSRIILITFIIFCLIMRTAYQSVQFEMMTKEMRKPLPKTVRDLVKQNYTFYLSDYSKVNIITASFFLNSLAEFGNFKADSELIRL